MKHELKQNLYVQRVHPNATLPEYAHPGDSGFDLALVENRTLLPGMVHRLRTGLAFQVPPGYELQIRPRSSTSSNANIDCKFGTVDSSYRGEVAVLLQVWATTFEVFAGMRLAQAVLAPVRRARLLFVRELDDTERGTRGFGSTGGQ